MTATAPQVRPSEWGALAQRRAAFEAEIARCDAGFERAKSRGDEPAAFYWSLQRSAAVRLLPVAQLQGALL